MSKLKEVNTESGKPFFVLDGMPAMEASKYMHVGDILEDSDGFRYVVDHRKWVRDADGYVVGVYFVPES
ncbi:hypothetical protein ACTUVN_001510 [Pseudomonas caspiana]